MKNANDYNPLDILLEENSKKEEIKIEVYINKLEYKSSVSFEFKIGLKSKPSNKLNIIRDIKQFIIYYENKVPLKFSNDFTFDINYQKISSNDLSIIRYIYDLIELEKNNLKTLRRHDKLIDGKYIYPPKYLIREFISIIKENRVYFNEGFYSRPIDCEIIIGNPTINFDIKLMNDYFKVEIDNYLPQLINNRLDIMIDGTTIYVPSRDYINEIKSYYVVFKGKKEIYIELKDEKKVLEELIPKINKISTNLNLSPNIKEKVVLAKPQFLFFFDKEDAVFSMILKVKYNECEFNIFEEYEDKVIYRDLFKEGQIISLLKSLGFDIINNKFYLNLGDDYIYNFFKYKIHKLQRIGQVYYSENFKGIKCINNKGIVANIAPGKFNYFELKFNLKDISNDEINHILKAFKNNLKYYKLQNGEFLDLEDIEIKNFLRLVNTLNNDNKIKEDTIEFNNNKALYLNEYINNYNLKFLKGRGYLREIKSKFNNIDKLKHNVPTEFSGKLRNYQYKGYCYFKTLDELGFGGILADEMGLGKTIQTIAFLCSKKDTNSLIIAPSSLIYNWHNEFKKFAPNLKVGVVSGNKEKRTQIIKEYNDYDVLVTTYPLIKNDIEDYLKINFDCIILDEAQYIKNSNSQNAKTVKRLKSKNKFALTGTPIENSLLELWSIFDFIMPGYLYDENTFAVKYHRRLMEGEEILEDLHRLINPFILRRYKKDVALELPPKIEKIIEVELPYEQKKIYSIYTNKIKEIVEDKIKDNDFTNGKIEILSYITKLRQLALDPQTVVSDYNGEVGKIEALVEILNQGIDEGHNILVFSQFTSVLENIKKRLNLEGITYNYLDGSISSKKRQEIVNDFNNGNNSVFLISLKAGGTGLNLQKADIVIHFDPWWNPAVEDQATDRSHRIGQNKIVEVIKLISKDTIEEKISILQNKKKDLINNILGENLSSENIISNLSKEEILNLFK